MKTLRRKEEKQMSYMDEFNFWLEDDYFDQGTKDELLAIRNDQGEIEERFYKELEFGTGGLRGIIGAGTNRMNIYTVRKATQGLAGHRGDGKPQSSGVQRLQGILGGRRAGDRPL